MKTIKIIHKTLVGLLVLTTAFSLMLPTGNAQAAYLFHSTFSTGMDGWEVGEWGGTAEWTTENHQLCVTVETTGSFPWELSIFRTGITLLHGQSYTVSYKISASQPATVSARLQHVEEPYTQYYWKEPLEIGEKQKVKETFTNEYADDSNVMFVFQVGGGLGNIIEPGTTICLDNISLSLTEPES